MKRLALLVFVCLLFPLMAQDRHKKPICDASILVADVFKPGASFFLPHFTGKKPQEFVFTIYNRWGENIFETRDHALGWNGSLENNEPAMAGIYLWVLRYSFKNMPEETCSGQVQLQR